MKKIILALFLLTFSLSLSIVRLIQNRPKNMA